MVNLGNSTEPFTVIGNGCFRDVEYKIPAWGSEDEACFHYKGDCFYFSEFLEPPEFLKESGFHGIQSHSYFSGLLIKLHSCNDRVAVYYYHC